MNMHNSKIAIMYRLALIMTFMVIAPALVMAQDATISSVSHDLDVMRGGERGILIHVKFYVDDMKGEDGRVNVYFYKSDGTALKDFDGRCFTTNGDAATYSEFTSDYDSTRFDNVEVFMPYRQLHLGKGRYDLKYMVTIEYAEKKRQLANSKYYSFSLDDKPVETN